VKRFRAAIIAIICVATPLTGCQTMRPVDLGSSERFSERVKPKDFVRVWMRDGRTLDLQLTAVEADALVSGEQRIPLRDIERLERRGISWTRTTLLVLGIAGVALVAVIASHPMAGFRWQ
jgi:hypothetical protein